MGETIIIIQQGAPIVTEDTITFLGIGSEGDPDACRVMTFPAAVSTALAPIVYAVVGICQNPDRTFNLDNDVLPHPRTATVVTLGTTKVLRTEESEDDVIVTEVWLGGDNLASMPTALFRQFYEYLINAPQFDPVSQSFITWEPRDRNTHVYNIEPLSLSVGGGAGETRFDVKDLREPGGIAGGGSIANALDSLAPAPTVTGLVDREVRLRFRIVGKV